MRTSFTLLLLLLVLTSCDRMASFIRKEKPATPRKQLSVPVTLKKGEKFTIEFKLSPKLKKELSGALERKTVYDSQTDHDISITNSQIICLVILRDKQSVLLSKEFKIDRNSLTTFQHLKLPVDLWTMPAAKHLKPGDQVTTTVIFKYFYETAAGKTYEKLHTSKAETHYLTKAELKKQQLQLKRQSFADKLQVVKQLDSFSLRVGFVAGAVVIILLILVIKVHKAFNGNKNVPGILLPGSQMTFVASRAIYELINYELTPFKTIRLIGKGLRRERDGYVITLDLACDLTQGNGGERFPETEQRLKEHLMAVLKAKLGLENIVGIHVNLKRSTLD